MSHSALDTCNIGWRMIYHISDVHVHQRSVGIICDGHFCSLHTKWTWQPPAQCCVSHLVRIFACSHFQHCLSWWETLCVLTWIWSVSADLSWTGQIQLHHFCKILHLLYVVLHILLPDSKSASDDPTMEKSVIQVCSVVKLFIQINVWYSLLTEVQIWFLSTWIHRQKHTSKCLWKPVFCLKMAQFTVFSFRIMSNAV